VDLFFVLSGYLIGNKLFSDIDSNGNIRFRHFYMNRAFRIFPAYLAAVAIYFSLPEVQEGRGLQPLWRFLTFTQNLPIDLRANTFSHAWSLCVEEHFYLALPLLLYILFAKRLHRGGGYILIGLIVLGILVRYVSWAELVEPLFGRQRLGAAFKYLYYPTYTRLDGLIIGVAIAALFRYQPTLRDRITRHGNIVMLTGVLVLLGCYQLFGSSIISTEFWSLPVTLAGFPLLSFGYGLLVVAALSPGSLLHRFQFRPTAALAATSYSVYLVHKMSNHWINENLTDYVDLDETQVFAVCLVAALLGGALLHFAIEKPFLMLRQRLAK
jgi:peptidoglycan/LPS O-acetylase OafA/YrhL